MRRFLMLLVACALGLGAGELASWLASEMLPCSGERLACSMDAIGGMVVTLFAAGIATVVFGVALYSKGDAGAVTIAMLILIAGALVFWAFVAYSQISVREFHDIRSGDIRQVTYMLIPALLTAIVPWLCLRVFIARAG